MNQSRVRQTRKSNKKKFSMKTFWKTFVICFLVEILLTVAVVGFGVWNTIKDKNLGGGLELEGTLSEIVAGESRNIVIFGTDKSGLRSDVIMVLSVYPDKDTLTLMSVPRDTKVQINRSTQKINAALQIGGDELAVQTVKDLLSIPIHGYVVVNFQAVETIIDELGGIYFDVPQDMYYQDPDQDLYININKGYQLLDGENSVDLLRYRSYPMGDLERNRVQQDFFLAAFSQKFQPQYIAKVPDIYGLINRNMRSNLSLKELLGYMSVLSGMENRTVQTFELPVTISDPYVIINREEADIILDEYYR